MNCLVINSYGIIKTMNGEHIICLPKTTSYCVYPDNSYLSFSCIFSLEYKGTFGSINAGYADWNSDLQTLTVVKYGK